MSRYKQLYFQSQLQVAGLISALENGGINPQLGLDVVSKDYLNLLADNDRADCVHRYKWKLPINLTSTELESFIYDYGDLCMFINPETHNFQIARFAQNGELTPYGRLSKIKPIDFAGHTYDWEMGVIQPDGTNAAEDLPVAIIIHDRTPSPTTGLCTPRVVLNTQTTIADEVRTFTQLANNVLLSIKRALALCDTEEQKNAVKKQVQQLLYSPDPIQAIATRRNAKGGLESPVEMFNFDNNFNTQNYAQTIDFYEKFRTRGNGIPAGEIFEKKERMITSETENGQLASQFILMDGFINRDDSCKFARHYLHVDIGVEIAEELKPKQNTAPSAQNKPQTGESGKGV